MTLAIIISASVEIIKLIHECQKEDTKSAVKIMQNPSFLDRIRLKWLLRRKLKGNYKTLKNSDFSFIKIGQDINEDMLKKLYEENISE